jgi:hypothetical protein
MLDEVFRAHVKLKHSEEARRELRLGNCA